MRDRSGGHADGFSAARRLADVATKHDLAELEARMDLRFENFELKLDLKLDSKLSGLRADLSREMRGWFLAVVTSFAALLALATAASGLLT